MKNRFKILILSIMVGILLVGCGDFYNTTENEVPEEMTDTDKVVNSDDVANIVEAADTEDAVDTKEATDDNILTAEEAYQRMQCGDPIAIVDVRTKEEYDAGHIEGAILIPNEEIGTSMPELLPVQDAEILVYCRSGNRSAQATKKLQDMGYSRVYDFGGINSWTYGTTNNSWENKAGNFASFRATDVNGMPVDETVFANSKLTMVNIWATFCGPCLNEMPEIGELASEYAIEDVQVLGIVIDVLDSDGTINQDQVAYARELIEETKADYRHLLPLADLIAAGLNQVNSVPTTLFIDSSGTIVGQAYIGSRDKASWKQIIDGLVSTM